MLHIYDDHGGVQPPEHMRVETWTGTDWLEAKQQVAQPRIPSGGRANTITFTQVKTDKIRVVFTHKGKARSGATEVEIWRQ